MYATLYDLSNWYFTYNAFSNFSNKTETFNVTVLSVVIVILDVTFRTLNDKASLIY